MPNTKFTISLLPNDRELIRFIDKKKKTQSLSAYVWELIRKDMNKNQVIPDYEQIYEYVEKRLQENGITMKDSSKANLKSSLDELDKELILDLF